MADLPKSSQHQNKQQYEQRRRHTLVDWVHANFISSAACMSRGQGSTYAPSPAMVNTTTSTTTDATTATPSQTLNIPTPNNQDFDSGEMRGRSASDGWQMFNIFQKRKADNLMLPVNKDKSASAQNITEQIAAASSARRGSDTQAGTHTTSILSDDSWSWLGLRGSVDIRKSDLNVIAPVSM